MPVLVTAFGPFGGRSENSSSLVVHKLRVALPEIRTRILPVDAVLAPSLLRQAIRRIRPSALIMLGEAAGSAGIRLKTTAWNLKDFGIPDIAGRQPVGVPVRRGAAESMPSTLSLKVMHDRLVAMGQSVSISDDPGRYLCNQLFFTALDFLQRNEMHVPAGFIHLPLESDLPTSTASEAIIEMIRLVSSPQV